MSKGLQHYPEAQRMAIANRRTTTETGGLGYWGAVGYLNKHGIRTKKQQQADAVGEIMRNAGLSEIGVNERREARHGPLRKQRTHKPVSSLSDRSKRTLASFRAQ